MGQKVHPTGFRLGVIRSWSSKWYEERNYAKWLHEDLELKVFIKKKLYHAGISSIEIERATSKVRIKVHTARPGIVIGKKGTGADLLKKEIAEMTDSDVVLDIHEVRKAEIDAQLIAESIATQLERRVSFRRAMKKSMQTDRKSVV